ncbi:MAG: hypothetical protein KDD25_06420, partial [Bdellovibrionales bacterium]|nr:hypothetical protein [Bdellovibrionales bacterium]
ASKLSSAARGTNAVSTARKEMNLRQAFQGFDIPTVSDSEIKAISKELTDNPLLARGYDDAAAVVKKGADNLEAIDHLKRYHQALSTKRGRVALSKIVDATGGDDKLLRKTLKSIFDSDAKGVLSDFGDKLEFWLQKLERQGIDRSDLRTVRMCLKLQ